MKIELLVTPGCSSREETEKALREILSELALEARFQAVVVDSPEKAAVLKFPGSPTVRINGQDLEPEADKSLNHGVGWRTYSGESGRLSKVPPRKLIRERIEALMRGLDW